MGLESKRATLAAAVVSLAGGTIAAACGADDRSYDGGTGDGGYGGWATSTSSTTSVTTSSGSGGLPPEQELESSYRAPVATGNFVWITNPDSGRVALIDATTLAIELVDAGNAPTYLAAVPDPQDDVAIVLNELSLDATLLRANADGSFESLTLEVPSGGNRWAISEDGRWATAWTDARDMTGIDPIDGFQDITVLDLHDGVSTSLSVGYRPIEVGYDAASSLLYAVTHDGVSVVSLDTALPSAIGLVPLSDEPELWYAHDVAITPDGSFALVRRNGQAAITIVSLATGDRTEVALSGPVTDLDLTHDGAAAIAVVRDTSEVAILPLPQAASDPLAITTFVVAGQTIGSVSLPSESSVGFLYTNAVPSTVLTRFDAAVSGGDTHDLVLHAPIGSVLPTQDGAHAVVVHSGVPSNSSYAAAVSFVPVESGLPSKIVGLEQELQSIAISPSGHRAIVAAGGELDATYSMLVAQLPSLQTVIHPLASRPIASGIVSEANRGFVAQEHPEGRISFVDFDDGEVRTLTGFELAAEVVDGSDP
jgi:DNA-binding beta-propeller fold protein YncE